MKVNHQELHLRTTACLQFIDLTELVTAQVRQSGIENGLINIQTRHTTTAIIVNENEPLLLEDMKKTLERLAPRYLKYQHDNFKIRTVNLDPPERCNGHAHCQAMFLSTSATLNVLDGKIQLGKWQRIFLIELDGARDRSISLMMMGN